jgi:hypothetical protein
MLRTEAFGAGNGLKIFSRPDLLLLKKIERFPNRSAPGANRAWCGRRRMSGALLISMLLNGGCGHEDLQCRPLLADQHRL